MSSPYYLILCLAFALFASVAMAAAVWPRRDDPTIRAFLLLVVGAGVWSGGRLMEVSAPDLASRLLWAKLQYIGIMLVPVGWLLAIARVSRPRLIVPRSLYGVPVAISVAALGLVFTNDSHGLIWASVRPVAGPEHPGAVFVHGPAYWILVVYCYLLPLGSLYFLCRPDPSSQKLRRHARFGLAAGLALPLCAHVAYLGGWTKAIGGDLTPATFSVLGVLVWLYALRPHLDDVGHYARVRVFDALQEGCVIVDAKGIVVDFNPAALRLIPTVSRGEPAAAWWLAPAPAAPAGVDYELSAEPVRNLDGKFIGRMLFLRDVRPYRTREHALVQENSSLAVRLNETVEKLSRIEVDLYRDSLTGQFNRRFFQRQTPSLVADARERGAPLGLLLIDVDYFKQYNDVYGHLFGDDCLRSVAAAIAGALTGSEDFCARVGGEEFAAVLPGAGPAETKAASLRVLQAVRALAIPHAGAALAHPFVTVSVGAICEIPQSAGFENLLGKADAAMYAAKRGGRDRFVMGGVELAAAS